MIAFFCFLFGLIVGSFLNVVVLRHGVKSLGGRSVCMSCGTPIVWYDNIPLLSWLLLGGRCRCCKSRISIQYPLVEVTTGILFAVFGSSYLGMSLESLYDKPTLLTLTFFMFVILAILVAIAVYDILHTIIPDSWVYTFVSFALVWGLFMWSSGYSVLWLLAAGPIAALPLFALWVASRGAWMGFGDVKLALGMGFLLGPALGLFAVFFAFVIGALISLPLVFLASRRGRAFLAKVTHTAGPGNSRARFTMKSEIPFGPFLIGSCITVWLLTIHGVDPLLSLGLLP